MIRETLRKKRVATEEHIRQLEREGKAGVRYTAMIPDMVFLTFGLLCDVGWVMHYIASYLYFRDYGFQVPLDWLMLVALAGSVVGVTYVCRLGWKCEKEIATRLQKNLSFGLTVWAEFAAGILGVLRAVSYVEAPASLICMTAGGFLGFVAGAPIYFSFRKGIVYGVQ